MHLTVKPSRLGGGGDGGGGNHRHRLGAPGHQQGSHLETTAGAFDVVQKLLKCLMVTILMQFVF